MRRLRFLVSVILAGPVMAAGVHADFFVAPGGNDAWSGKFAAPNPQRTDGPFASVARAQAALRDLIHTHPARPLTVMLRGGTYYLPSSPTKPGTLLFTNADSGAAGKPVTWTNYPGETPVISGAACRSAKVASVSTGRTYPAVSGRSNCRLRRRYSSIFIYNGDRRLRSRVQSPGGVGYYMKDGACYSTVTGKVVETAQCNVGTFLRVASEIAPEGVHAGCPKVSRAAGGASKCLDRFSYDPRDPIGAWANLNPGGSICGGSDNKYPPGDVELTLFDAWTIDMMRVSCVDTTNHVIYFTAATKGNQGVYNMFGPVKGHRYVVDNTKDAFDAAREAGKTGIWFLDRSASPWTLNSPKQ